MMDEHDRYWLDVATDMVAALAILLAAALALFGLVWIVAELGQRTN